MHLKGYLVKYGTDNVVRLHKSDYAGDISHTARAWHQTVNNLKALPTDSYPITIVDKDEEHKSPIILNNQNDFTYWLKNDFK